MKTLMGGDGDYNACMRFFIGGGNRDGAAFKIVFFFGVVGGRG
jgi:hypothetical protein